jgi:hypothetical protein
MVETAANTTEFIRLRMLPAGGDLSGFLLPVPGFPVPEQELVPIRKFLGELISAVLGSTGASHLVFVQHSELDFERAAPVLSRNAPKWRPQTGLGIWLNREPPSFWKPEEFMSLEPGQRPRPLMDKVFHLTGPGATDEARDLVFGLGSLLQILVSGGAEAYLQRTTARLRPRIVEEAFQNFPFYLPLLDGASLDAANLQTGDDCLCGASAYIRESRQDQAILILSPGSLRPVLASLGGRLEPGPEPEWRF